MLPTHSVSHTIKEKDTPFENIDGGGALLYLLAMLQLKRRLLKEASDKWVGGQFRTMMTLNR